VLGVAGVAGLLAVMIIIIALIAGGGDDSGDEVTAGPTPTVTATPTKTPKPKKTPVPLTPTELTERQAAIDLVVSKGFEVVRKRDWDPDTDLKVLIGRSSTGGRLAFFFVAGDYIGNDSTETSADLKVKSTDGLEVTLVYGTPSGPVSVQFRYDGATLAPVQLLPSATDRAAGSE
jgi:hypothetical protein